MIKSIKEFTKYEKLRAFQEYNFYKNERKHGARYLNAIRTNNTSLINWYESFGDSLHKIILNVKTYERNIELGFPDEKVYNEYGWIIEGKVKPGTVIQIDPENNVFVNSTPNLTWVKGRNCMTNNSGSFTGGSIWDKEFPTEKEALIAGIEEFIDWYQKELKSCKHSSDNYDDETGKVEKVSVKELYCTKMINRAMYELHQIKTPQLTLF